MSKEQVQIVLEELIDEAPDEWTLEKLTQVKEFFFNLSN